MIDVKNVTAENFTDVLKELCIPFEMQEHKAIFCEEDGKDVDIFLKGIEVKNLFVKDKENNFALVSMDLHKRADLKKIALCLGFGRLSFCSAEELMEHLNITPGSVTPFCIMFDKQNCVKVLIDEQLKNNNVIVHPLRNTASVSLSFEDLIKFIEYFTHSVQLGDVYKLD